MTFWRVKANLSGWEGAPGVNVYHFEVLDTQELDNVATLLHNAYDGVKAYLLQNLKIDIDPEALHIDTPTGQLVGTYQMTGQPTVTGTGTNPNIPRATMAVVRHNTDLIYEGQRVNGRTFVGPIAQGVIDGSGHITQAAQTAFSAMYDGLQDLTGGRLMVYHRPRKATETKPASAGAAGHVQQSVCLAIPGSLRSRRD